MRNLGKFALFALAVFLGVSGVLELFRGDIGDGVIWLAIAAFLALWAFGLGLEDDGDLGNPFEPPEGATPGWAEGRSRRPADVGSSGGTLLGLSTTAYRALVGEGVHASIERVLPTDTGLQSWVAWYRENDLGAARADFVQLDPLVYAFHVALGRTLRVAISDAGKSSSSPPLVGLLLAGAEANMDGALHAVVSNLCLDMPGDWYSQFSESEWEETLRLVTGPELLPFDPQPISEGGARHAVMVGYTLEMGLEVVQGRSLPEMPDLKPKDGDEAVPPFASPTVSDATVHDAVEAAARWLESRGGGFGPSPVEISSNVDEAVTRCVLRFASSEAVGERIGRPASAVFLSLGEVQKRLARSGEGRAVLRDVAMASLGFGFAFLTGLQAGAGHSEVTNRSPEDLWNAWTARLSSELLEAVGIPPDAITVLRNSGVERGAETVASLRLDYDQPTQLAVAYLVQAGAELSALQHQGASLIIQESSLWSFTGPPSPLAE